MGAFAVRARASYDAATVRTIEVPEWDMTLHVGPYTLAQRAQVEAGDPDPYTMAIRVLGVRAKHADGTRCFDAHDLEMLELYGSGPYGPEVVARVTLEIQSDQREPDIEAKAGN